MQAVQRIEPLPLRCGLQMFQRPPDWSVYTPDVALVTPWATLQGLRALALMHRRVGHAGMQTGMHMWDYVWGSFVHGGAHVHAW